jgi:Thiol:disulfide interchange protein DsbD, N-terminal
MSAAPQAMTRGEAPGELGTVSIDASARREGSSVNLTLRVDIPDNTHIEAHEPPEPFLIPTVLEIEDLSDVSVDYPSAEATDIGVPGAELLVYRGTVTIAARGKADRSIAALKGALRYQPCVGGACLPPRSAGWETSLEDH